MEGGWEEEEEEEHGAVRREDGAFRGTAAVWASSLLARLLKVIIEFLCRASPPCGMLRSAHYEVDRDHGSGNQGKKKKKKKLAASRGPPRCDLTCNKRQK